jgi:hypothetical protein
MAKIHGARAGIYIFLGTVFAGAVVCVIGILVGAALLRGELGGFGALAGGLLGATIGFPLGVIGGIILLHRLLHYNGSVWFGILGVVVAVGLVIGLSGLFDFTENTDIIFTFYILAPPLLCTVGYCLGRKKQEE